MVAADDLVEPGSILGDVIAGHATENRARRMIEPARQAAEQLHLAAAFLARSR